jgi:endonuclease YncB( thermonuclease family)
LEFIFVDDINVNNELIKNGLVGHYKYFNNDADLDMLEKQARARQKQ